MPVEDVFTISGRGTVATGRVERGVIKKNEPVEIVGLSDEKKSTVVTDIEMFHKLMDYAEAGDNIGALLRGIDKKSIERGQVLSKPGSIHPHTKFVGQVYVLSKDEGGRQDVYKRQRLLCLPRTSVSVHSAKVRKALQFQGKIKKIFSFCAFFY